MGTSRKKARFSIDLSEDVSKPQLEFEDEINNFGPYVPRIVKKPNALPENPLPKALIEYNLKENGHSDVPTDEVFFEHPYKKELEMLEFSKELLMKVEPLESSTFPDTPCEVICSEKLLLSMTEKLKKCREIAVDLEGHTYNSYQGFTCLLQISSRSEDFLIDALKLRSHVHHLNDIFTDPNIVKVLHGSGQDVLWLQRDFGVYVVNLFDTDIAARVVGHRKTALDVLLSEYCAIESKDKAEMQMTDWRVRPLSEKKRRYAQKDTHYLLYIYDVLKNKLLENEDPDGDSKLLHVFEQGREICLKKYEKPSSDAFIKKNQGKFNPGQFKLLQLLCEWREGVARDLDESMGYVMPNSMLLTIVNKMPNSLHKLFPLARLQRHPLIEVHRKKINGFLKEAKKLSSEEVANEHLNNSNAQREESSKKHIFFSDSDDAKCNSPITLRLEE